MIGIEAHKLAAVGSALCILILMICARSAFAQQEVARARAVLGLPALESHAITHRDQDLAFVGKRLFFDKRLSVDGAVSCAACHLPEKLFTDGLPRAKGIGGKLGTRNAPSLLNVAYSTSLFWDGRAGDLASQARAPFTNPVEHALPSEEALLRIVRSDAAYVREFMRVFATDAQRIRVDMIADAIVAYERTLLAGGSRFDRYMYAHDRNAMPQSAIRGLELFRGRAGCSACHVIGAQFSLLTDQKFHVAVRGLPRSVTENLAERARAVVTASNESGSRALEQLIATDPGVAALGRFVVTLDPADIGKFKTPSLRNVALTAPYMHDGGVSTLEEAVDLELYSRDVVATPIVLTAGEKSDLLEFLRALSTPLELLAGQSDQ